MFGVCVKKNLPATGLEPGVPIMQLNAHKRCYCASLGRAVDPSGLAHKYETEEFLQRKRTSVVQEIASNEYSV